MTTYNGHIVPKTPVYRVTTVSANPRLGMDRTTVVRKGTIKGV